MSHYYAIALVDEAELGQARLEIGAGLARIVGYFREDGAKSIIQLEQALAARDAAAMVLPAHMLKGEARQFGGIRLGDIAETIEKTARRCVEHHSEPTEVATEVAMLRSCFIDTLAILENNTRSAPASAPLSYTPRASATMARPKGFGRRTAS